MAINPQDLNLIDIKGLTVAFNPILGWVIPIQDPTGNVINQIPLSVVLTLLGGTVDLPNGIISGLDITIDNSGTPKVGSVTPGEWRIDNVKYNRNTVFNFNINTAGASNRTDAVIADSTGLTYVVGFTSLSAGQILVSQFVVASSGADIVPGAVLKSNPAYMNALNSGNLNITGDFLQNGIPLNLGGLTTLTKNETNLISSGDGFYSLPITLTGEQQVLSVAIDGRSIPIQFESGILINFDNNNPQTIKIKIG